MLKTVQALVLNWSLNLFLCYMYGEKVNISSLNYKTAPSKEDYLLE